MLSGGEGPAAQASVPWAASGGGEVCLLRLQQGGHGATTVSRYRCHYERGCRPEHLIEGLAADNKRDDWDYWANGVDYG